MVTLAALTAVTLVTSVLGILALAKHYHHTMAYERNIRKGGKP